MNAPENTTLLIELANEQNLAIEEPPLTDVARMIVEDHGYRSGEISIAVVDDPTMRRLNKQYLDHDYETDVLSFVLDVDDDNELLNGQLIVSADTAQRVASEIGISLDDELLLYVIHGCLHLVGLRDKDDDEAREMRAAEASYLARYGVKHHWEDSDDTDGAPN